MTFRTTIAAVTLAGATLAGGIAATAAVDTGAPRRAADEAKAASRALAGHKIDKAVAAAEAAVALQPQEARYRALLGQAYLMAGRFVSASDALKDALALNPADGAAALNLALAQIGTGNWATARETLAAHEASIAPADRGLALALAGDPGTAVAILTAAARGPESDAKTRQNLALSLALAGRWPDAKFVAGLDVAPDQLDKRIMQWAAFARPQSASDQVAALLGVTPIEDGGQPQRLALNITTQAMAAVAQVVDPVDAFRAGNGDAAKVAAVAVATPSVETLAEGDAPAPAPAVTDVASVRTVAPTAGVVFGPRAEIVQSLPSRASRPAPVRAAARIAPDKPVQVAVAPRVPAKGSFYVQLGAFENGAVAQDKWGHMVRRNAALASLTPAGVQVTSGGTSFYRLSVGGFARGDADRLCATVKRAGGRCFVRVSTGDAVASWVRTGGGVQLAAR
ncbi:tetratricopeptide repeat protein [Sphingomonas sp.]|uniref:tetratricopeptide repeat protein n=1 Tax=Sphingomonas sp. TaxID=28214 RepID=UPI002CD8AFEF|nr:tetratricopeptide repeat protein [Sphingomonas sp.]HWK36744.1 tetratricopeptide repeat protein [Sphingomonas sp.]